MSFTHKVTARNLFRYKKRMWMTVFGVCGAVTMLFTGFSMQHSISGVKERQFGRIIRYDLIVAQNTGLTAEKQAALEALLADDAVERQTGIYYETVTRTASKNGDRQSIKMIVPQTAQDLDDYIALQERTTGRPVYGAGRGQGGGAEHHHDAPD